MIPNISKKGFNYLDKHRFVLNFRITSSRSLCLNYVLSWLVEFVYIMKVIGLLIGKSFILIGENNSKEPLQDE